MTRAAGTGTVVYRRWALAWLGAAGLGVLNGGLRRAYEPRLGELRAHQVSAVTLGVALTPYALAVHRRAALPHLGAAVRAGGLWVGMTVVFEFGLGHYVNGNSWQALLSDYDLTSGRLWALDLAWIGILPALARRVS